MTHTVKSGDSLFSISKKYNIPVEQIRSLNKILSDAIYPGQILLLKAEPSTSLIRKHTVRAGESLYAIARQYGLSVTELKQLNPLASSNLRIGQELIISSPEKQSPQQNIDYYHTVSPGESLYQIAEKYHITVSELVRLNGLLSNNLRVGQVLKVKEIDSPNTTPTNNPTKINEFYTVIAGDSLFSIAQKAGISVRELMDWNELKEHNLRIGQVLRLVPKSSTALPITEKPQTSNPSDMIIYVVKLGDSLFSIAQKYNTSVDKILNVNELNDNILHIGQQLLIPANQTQTPTNLQSNTESIFHTVQLGESLYSISQRYGIDLAALRQQNQLDNNNFLAVGQRLLIRPAQGTVSNPTPTTQPQPAPTSGAINTNLLPSQMKNILEARKIIKIQQLNGEDIFAGGLRGAVGRNRVNRPDDLQKVQTRLVQLNMLTRNHRESPEDIQKVIGNAALTANYIPMTIQAIERFQEQFRVRFWIDHSSRVSMMKTSSFTQGVVVPGDITDKMLREYTEYTLSFPHPTTEQELTVRFNNFTRSSFTEYYQGISYVGTSNPEIPLVVFERLGADKVLAEALRYVSKHEGNFDAINSYDKAIFSYGFIQFAGNGGGLVPMLAGLKQKAPQVFQTYFQDFGIDVNIPEGIVSGQRPELVVANPYDRGGKYLARGIEAERVLRADKVLHGVFIRAGHYLPVVTMQIDAALRDYVRPALSIRVNIVAGALRLVDVPITQFINSAMGTTLLIDLTVNRWTVTTRRIFQEAIEKVAVRERLYSQTALEQIDERKVIEQIIEGAKIAQDTRLLQRASNIYQSDLSWQKSK